MKKIIFLFIILSSLTFSVVKDTVKIFSPEEIKTINNRINLIKEQTEVDFDIVTLAQEDKKVFDSLKNNQKKVIVVLEKGVNNSIKVKVAFTNDINLNGYEDKITNDLEELKSIISPKTLSDYTLELLADMGDILTTVKNDQILAKQEKEGIDKKSLMIFIFKSIGYLLLVILGYVVYVFINRKRVLTYCKTCDKQMELQDDINTDKENMKIYACPSCGKVRRVIYKKRR